MNTFCVGQKLIDVLTRKTHIVSALRENGVIVVDGTTEAMESDFIELEHYLDYTNYLYHHSRFGDGQELATEGFREYLEAIEELSELNSDPLESVFKMQVRAYCLQWIDEAAEKIQKGLAWKRTAEYNMAQWHGVTLDHHFPYLNPEGLTDY